MEAIHTSMMKFNQSTISSHTYSLQQTLLKHEHCMGKQNRKKLRVHNNNPVRYTQGWLRGGVHRGAHPCWHWSTGVQGGCTKSVLL